jgi:hypothetical protein
LVGFPEGKVAVVKNVTKPAESRSEYMQGFHQGIVSVVAGVPEYFSYFFSGGSDGVLRLWNSQTQRCILQLNAGNCV